MADMSKPKVLLAPHFRTLQEIFATADLGRLRSVADVEWCRDEPLPPSVLAAHLPDVAVLVGTHWQLTAAQIAGAEKLCAIMDVAGSFPPGIDYDACFARGIRILTCAPAFGPQVAEMALAMTLAAGRGLVTGHADMQAGREIWQDDYAGDFSLYGQPLGFIGFGSIAQNFLRLIAPFRCKVRVSDPWLPPRRISDLGCQPAELKDLLSQSRVVYVFAPPTTENRHLLDEQRLALMPRHALLILISRAHLVDFDALTRAVAAGRIRAAIDVFPEEPLATDHPIRHAPGTILSAHRAASIRRERHAIGRMVADDIELIARGLPPQRMQLAQPELVGRQARAHPDNK